MQKEAKKEFLGKLYILFKRSDKTYASYLQNNKQFLFAKILKKCNDNILQLLVENSHLLSDELIKDSMELIFHLDIWIEKWNYFELKQKPKIEDSFVFENEHTFPHNAVQNLKEEFLATRSAGGL